MKCFSRFGAALTLSFLLFLLFQFEACASDGDDMTEQYSNRLVHESSPYLLQHAHNPVDWYPWGEEAFARARKEDKPIFLSIGYSTCHWCHVMEEEVFSDPEAAALINRIFVAIKVDREERPDIDQVYMTASQIVTGSGGWPLNVFMTPDKQPFHIATYIPKQSRYGHPGVMQLLPRIEEAWKKDRQGITKSANSITKALQSVHGGKDEGTLKPAIFEATFTQLEQQFDQQHGGFGEGQKFPRPHNMRFLLRHWQRLFELREKRIHPFKDRKALVDWNGLMIAALAMGGRLLEEPAYLKAAETAAKRILQQMRSEDGRLLHRWNKSNAVVILRTRDNAAAISKLATLHSLSCIHRRQGDSLCLLGLQLQSADNRYQTNAAKSESGRLTCPGQFT